MWAKTIAARECPQALGLRFHPAGEEDPGEDSDDRN